MQCHRADVGWTKDYEIERNPNMPSSKDALFGEDVKA
jgi:hypothetical protein